LHDIKISSDHRTVTGFYEFVSPFWGILEDGTETNTFRIGFTARGNAGIPQLFHHGVPTNRRQWYPVQWRCAPFTRTVSMDFLGMGESSKPRSYGDIRDGPGHLEAWKWMYDNAYTDGLMWELYGDDEFVYTSDDWGSGPAAHFIASGKRGPSGRRMRERVAAAVFVDPIAFDGYPVGEIQAIGRASMLPYDPENPMSPFHQAMGAFDQTLVQIYKTMVYNSGNGSHTVYNQYSLRDIKWPFVDVDYERNGRLRSGTGRVTTIPEGVVSDGRMDVAKSVTLGLNMHNIRVLTERASILSPALLLPYHPRFQPDGVRYDRVKVPVQVQWGEYDNMMPANQVYRYKYAMSNTSVNIVKVPRAGHFAGTDNPDTVAANMLNFLNEGLGLEVLADAFLGYDGIWKGDESVLLASLRKIYDFAQPV